MSVEFSSSHTIRNYSWTAWKAAAAAKSDGRYQYDDDGIIYLIWFYDGEEVHRCSIWKGIVPDGVIGSYSQNQNDADKSDFETNYKNTANTKLVQRVEISGVTALSSQPLTVSDRTFANVVRTQEFDISSRSEVQVLSYTVASGKTLYLSYFGAAVFAPLPAIFRLKVNGSTAWRTLAGQNSDGRISPILCPQLAVGGNAVVITVEAQVPHGSAWAAFSGLEV